MQAMKWRKVLSLAASAVLLGAFTAAPAFAQEPQADQRIVIDEDADDDLYLFGEVIIVNADVDGDIIAFGRSLEINGTVTGDVIFGGRDLILNGTIEDDLRAGAYLVRLAENSTVGDDINTGTFSFEMLRGSSAGGHVYFGSAQALLNDIGGNVAGGSDGIEFRGTIGGNTEIGVAPPDESAPDFTWGDLPAIASIPPGLTFGEGARFDGDFTYTSSEAQEVPAGAVEGSIEFVRNTDTSPAAPGEDVNIAARGAANLGFQIWNYFGFVLISFVLLLLAGILTQRFFPDFLDKTRSALQNKPLPSFGFGLLGYFFFFVFLAMVIVLFIFVILPLLFVTLGGASVPIFRALSVISVVAFTGMGLITRWLAPVLFALLIGEAVFGLISRERKAPFWSLFIGLLMVTFVLAIPVFGRGLLSLIVGVFGLGAVIIALRDEQVKPTVSYAEAIAADVPPPPKPDEAPAV